MKETELDFETFRMIEFLSPTLEPLTMTKAYVEQIEKESEETLNITRPTPKFIRNKEEAEFVLAHTARPTQIERSLSAERIRASQAHGYHTEWGYPSILLPVSLANFLSRVAILAYRVRRAIKSF